MKRKFACITFIKLILILLLTSINSCDEKNKYQDLLSKADSIMNIEDDSAVIAIRMLDDIKPKLVNFNKKQKMRYHLLYHKAMNKAYIQFKSDSIMLEVTKYYEQSGTANERMLTYYILGCVYRDMHEAPMALEFYNKATEQADTTSKDCDYATLCRIYNQMGILFDIQHLPYQELNALNKAMYYALIAKDTLNAIRYYSNRIGAFTCLSQEDSIFNINKQAARLFLKHGDVLDYKIALGSNFSYYLKHKQLIKAKKAFELYQSSNYKGNPNYEDTFAYQLYEQGMLCLELGKYDSAYSCLKKSLETSKSYSNKAAATKGLSFYFSKTKMPSLAAKYAIESSMYNDSDLLITRNSQLQQIQAIYDYNRNKNMAIESKLVAEQRMNLIYLIILCFVILLMGASYFYKKRIIKKNSQMAIVQQLYNENLRQMRMAQTELVRLRGLNEEKIRSLINEKEAEVNRLQEKIKKYNERNVCYNIVELNKKMADTPIYKKLVFLETHPKEQIDKKDWCELEEMIGGFVYGFAVLKQKLSLKEYRICILIKLGFSPSTISHFIGTSLSDISLSRQRMFTKVCGKVGRAKDFDEYIRHIL